MQTPAAHTRGFDAVERSMNGTPSIVSILDPSKHNIVSQSDAGISDEPFNELLTASPAPLSLLTSWPLPSEARQRRRTRGLRTWTRMGCLRVM